MLFLADKHIATDITGWIATCISAFFLLPQAIKMIQTRSAKDVSLVMTLMIFCSKSLWIGYGSLLVDEKLLVTNLIKMCFVIAMLVCKIIWLSKNMQIEPHSKDALFYLTPSILISLGIVLTLTLTIPSKSLSIDIVGWMATMISSSFLISQIIKIIRTKSVKDISIIMTILLVVGSILWMSYAILIGDIKILVTNLIQLVFACTTLASKIIYIKFYKKT